MLDVHSLRLCSKPYEPYARLKALVESCEESEKGGVESETANFCNADSLRTMYKMNVLFLLVLLMKPEMTGCVTYRLS